MPKVCTVCRADVSQRKRVKDQQGNYYCHPCWNARADSVEHAGPATAAAAGSADGDVLLDELAWFEAASAKQGYTKSTLVACTVCGGRFPYADIQNHEGQPVCGECFWKAAASATPVEEVASDGTKECPFCAERIQAKAKKCRFCGERLEEAHEACSSAPGGASAVSAPVQPTAARSPAKSHAAIAHRQGQSGKSQLTKILAVCGVVMLLAFSCIPLSQLLDGGESQTEAARRVREENERTDKHLEQQNARLDEQMRDFNRDMGYVETGLPLKVKLEGDTKDVLSFRGWRLDEVGDVRAVMTWNGKHRVEQITYTVKNNAGVVLRKSNVTIPGSQLKMHEPTEIRIALPDETPSKLEVVIETQW